MKILSLDPSANNTGWAVLQSDGRGDVARIDSGTWHPSAREGAPDRYDQLAAFVRDSVARHTPEAVVVETPAGGQRGKRSATQLMVYARAIGVIEGVASLYAPVARATVTAWKGSVRKGYTDLLVRGRLKYVPGRSDEADAIGLGLWYLDDRQRNGWLDRLKAAEAKQTDSAGV